MLFFFYIIFMHHIHTTLHSVEKIKTTITDANIIF